MIDYQIFGTTDPDSPEWNAAEIAVLSRAFELKRLTVVSRGKRKNQIDIASPGKSLSSRPTDLKAGVLEWAIAHEAFEVYREFRPIQEATKGFLAVYLNPNPISRASIPIFFREVAQTLGWQVGFAAALWNDIGSAWPDLWDYYGIDTVKTIDPVYQPFLKFFRLLQSSRLSWEDADSYPEMAQSVIERMLSDLSDMKRDPFAQDSSVIQVLLSAGVSQEKIDSLREAMRAWPTADYILSVLETYDRFKETTSTKRSSGSIDDPFAKDNPSEARRWNAVGKLLGSTHIKEQIEILVKILASYGVKLSCDQDVQELGKFDIQIDADEMKIFPSISVDKTAPSRLALCHEIGHFVHNSFWVIELRLAYIAIKYLRQKNTQAAGELTFLPEEIREELIQNYSAMETAADEFAVDVLIPKRVRKVLLDFCSTEKGFRATDFLAFALDMLGIRIENLSLYERFSNIIDDKMPHSPLTTPTVMHGENLRKVRLLISKRRVERHLDSFWSNALAIIAGSSPTKPTRSTSRTTASIRSELYFEGIVCK
jgi:hypothetical protein